MSIGTVVERGVAQAISGADPGAVTISAPTPGALLIAFISAATTGSPAWTSITGTNYTGPNAWQQAPNPLNTINHQEIWWCIVPSSPGTVLTFNHSGTLGSGATTYKVIEVPSTVGWGSSPIDVSNGNSGTSTNPATGTITPTSGRNAIIVACSIRGGATVTAGPTNSFTPLTDTSPVVLHYAYRTINTGTTGTYSTDWTVNASGTWGVTFAVFDEAAAATFVGDDDGTGMIIIAPAWFELDLMVQL